MDTNIIESNNGFNQLIKYMDKGVVDWNYMPYLR